MYNKPLTQSNIYWMMVVLVLCFLLMASITTPAQDNSEIYDVLESAQEVLDTVIKEVTNGEYQFPYQLTSADEFDQALMDFQKSQGSGDLETMAKWFPNVSELMSYVDTTPGLEPYADWLRQRIDYAAVANDAVSTIALPQPLSTPAKLQQKATAPVAQKTPPEIFPTLRPQDKQSEPVKKSPKPAAVKSNQRIAYARDADTWSKKLAGRPEVESAEKLVPALKKIFSAQGVPPELVWMAEVESTFNPAARSPAGAVGLFQLMPATAEHLGLQLKPQDQRLDPTKNGQAAAKYLKDLHVRFDDWPLAIAAYNGGEGRISKLLKANGARNLDAISDQLPSQTQMYVPKVLATIRHREGYDPSTHW